MTEAHGDEDAAKLVADFSDAVKSEVPASQEYLAARGRSGYSCGEA